MKLRYIIFTIMLLLSGMFIYAQPSYIPEELKRNLQGKSKLTEIMAEVEKYYDTDEKRNARKPGEEQSESTPYIQWKRWEWWMSSHLDADGNFVNIPKRNQEAMLQLDARYKKTLDTEAAGRIQKPVAQQLEQRNSQQPANPDLPLAPYGDWGFVGPTGDGAGPGDIKGTGRLDRIAFHPTDANIIYVGAPSGNLWKTTNGGTSWSSVTDGLSNPGVAGLVISPTNGNVVYLLSGDGDSFNPGYLVYDFGSSRASSGVYKTTDGGVSWSLTGPLFTGAGNYEGHKLAISPTDGNHVLAATSQGIYRTTNGGTSWTQVRTGEHWDVEFKPGSNTVVYATTGAAIIYSTDGGVTWNTATTDFSVAGSGRIELAVSPANSNYVYAFCGAVPAAGTFTGIFRSTNSGVSYTRRTNTPNILGSSITGTGTGQQSNYDHTLTVKPGNADVLVTGGLICWRSTTGGTTMINSTVYRESQGPASTYIHPDIHEVAFNPLNNNLFAATDGGFYRSTDDGVSWTNLTSGIYTTQFYGMAMRDIDANGEADGLGLLAGAQDNGMKHRTNAGASLFNHVICCDGYGTAISPDNANVLYININDGFYKSSNGGTSTSFILTSTFFSAIAIDYSNPDTVYLGGASTRRSFDGFATTNLTIATNTRRVLTTCPSNTSRLYGSSGTSLVRSDDRIATWTSKTGSPGWVSGLTVNDIDVYPTNSLEVYVCFGGYSTGNKVLRSTDGGDSWTNWSGSLPNIPTYGLAVATEGVYVGTEMGVFFRGYSMTDWVPFYNQMPRTPVTELVVNANGLIYASTFGRGVWLANRRSACSASVLVSGVKTGAWYYEASTDVTGTFTTPGTQGDSLFAQGGATVTLNPGLEVKAGSFFKGYIAPCSNGGIPNTPASAEENAIPRITEINVNKQAPKLEYDYFRVVDDRIEFYVSRKAAVNFLLKTVDGKWQSFYPGSQFYPGFYSLPLPQYNTDQFKVIIDNKEIKEVK